MNHLKISKASCTINPSLLVLFGPLGAFSLKTPVGFSFRPSTFPALLTHLYKRLEGVLSGCTLKLYLQGVGYRVWLLKQVLLFDLGCSNFFSYAVPPQVGVVLAKGSILLYAGDPLLLSTVANHLCNLRPHDSYKGKGIVRSQRLTQLKKKKKDGK